MNNTTPRILDRIRRSLDRDRALPAAHLATKALRYGAATALGPLYLLGCDRVGPGARAHGRPVIANAGSIEIGARAHMSSRFSPITLSTRPGGRIAIGDDVAINFGCSIAAESVVTLGHRVSLGPYVTIDDGDGEVNGERRTKPITIGDDVWLAARVHVCGGAVIGDGAVITAGSEVVGEIPKGVVAGGKPARVLRVREAADAPPPATDVAAPAPAAIVAPEVRGLLVSDFSIQELAAHLRAADPLGPRVDAVVAPFGQVVQTLLTLDVAAAANQADFALVWTRPESIVRFRDRLLGDDVALDDMLAEVDAFAARIVAASAKIKHVFVPTWTLPAYERGLGMIDAQRGGVVHALMRMNVRLVDALEKTPNVIVLDASRWIAKGGATPTSSKLWLLGKVAFSPEVFAEAARDLRAALRGLRGAAKKLAIVDLDNTLWHGIVGDVGWENLRLGGHDPIGEAYVEFQRRLKALTRRGVLLAIVSKNEESVALDAIGRHPEMVLRVEDFVGHKINWRDKAANVAALVAELNLGLQSVIFIDDNPVERARVRDALPEVYVPEWPVDELLYPEALSSLRCFDAPSISREDAERTKLYAAERGREALKQEVGSLDDWLLRLGTKVDFAPLDAVTVARASQLMNKTNQMNLSTRRIGEAELMSFAKDPLHEVWTLHVSDTFGKAGLTGVLGISMEGDVLRVVDYVLSCRVMGRRVEETMLAAAIHRAKARGAKRVEARYLATAKNKPCFGFLQASGLAFDEATQVFSWRTEDAYPFPAPITVSGLAPVADEEVLHAA